jgi:hypothetical protein
MKPPSNASSQESGSVEAEIQHDIPVKQHISDIKNPITNIKQFVDHNKKDDKELDQVLQDVNKSIKEPEKSQKKKFGISLRSKKTKPMPQKQPVASGAQQQKKQRNPVPILSVAAAIFVAGCLCVAAVYALNQPKETATNNKDLGTGQTTNSTTSQTTDSVITSKDVDELSSNLQSKVDGFNDEQEFNSTDLSDSSLGL